MFTLEAAKVVWEKVFENSVTELPFEVIRTRITYDLTNYQPEEQVKAKLENIFERAEMPYPEEEELWKVKAGLLTALSQINRKEI